MSARRDDRRRGHLPDQLLVLIEAGGDALKRAPTGIFFRGGSGKRAPGKPR